MYRRAVEHRSAARRSGLLAGEATLEVHTGHPGRQAGNDPIRFDDLIPGAVNSSLVPDMTALAGNSDVSVGL